MFSIAILFIFGTFFYSAAFGAGEIDQSFNAYLGDVPRGVISKTLIQPDGKIIIAGEFKLVDGVAKPNLVRLNPDGTLDTTFNPPVIYSSGAGYPIQAIALQTDGKIVISGQFTNPRSAVARLNADGTPDTAFNSSPAFNNFWYGGDLKIGPDGKIIVSVLKLFTSSARNYLMSLNPDGTLNAETEIDVGKINVQTDGKIILTNSSGILYRLNPDMSADNSFATVSPNNTVDEIILQPDGKIIIGGAFTTINGSSLMKVARINTNGSVDTTFNINANSANTTVHALVYLPNGKILVGGDFSIYNGVTKHNVVLLNSDGTLDASFTPINNFFWLYDLAVQADGKIVAGGSPFADTNSALVRLNTDGSGDASFQPVIGNFGLGRRVIVQPDNKILVGGQFTYVNGTVRKNVVRFNADGTLDTSFNTTNLFLYSITALELLPDGKILTNDQNNVVRLNSNGTLDIDYGTDGGGNVISDIKALPDGRSLVAKGAKLFRHNTDGSIDSSFNVTVSGTIYKVALQPDGKILIGGSFTNVNSTIRGKIARLNADGTIDATFNPPGGATGGTIVDLALQPDGKVLVGGDFTGINFDANRPYLARLNSDGTLDSSFNHALNNAVYTIKIQPDGKILTGGNFTAFNNVPRFRYARLNSNGTLDVTLRGGNGANYYVRDIDQQSDGKIIMVGDFETVNGVYALGIVRLLNAPTVARTSFDYDGDGRSDISVFRPSENKWYVLRSSDGQVTQQVFAIAGDVPVPADYDGDGKTDFAIFRPSSGDWWSLSTVNGSQVYAHWGASGDFNRPSDYDGDGRSDYVVFRPSNSFWYRISSNNGTASNKGFGLAGDKPVTGDFDGDGKSDVAIFRPSTGDWWWQSSADNVQRATHWGISTDVPAPADYDGDGITDFAVFRPSTGAWYIYNSGTLTSTILNFGLAEDKPVPADYDGDGKADIAVFRPSTGIWYLMKSSEGFTAQQFGVSTDTPTENAFVP
ncbi:MAG TPA: FG-GAP-like repeat-containing protein [Pyrinomonadaceae bacterium]